MKPLKIGDYAYIYFEGYEVKGVVKSVRHNEPLLPTLKKDVPNDFDGEYDYWNYTYLLQIDDDHILENYDLDTIKYWFDMDKNGFITKKVRGNDVYFDIDRTREERLKKLLDK